MRHTITPKTFKEKYQLSAAKILAAIIACTATSLPQQSQARTYFINGLTLTYSCTNGTNGCNNSTGTYTSTVNGYFNYSSTTNNSQTSSSWSTSSITVTTSPFITSSGSETFNYASVVGSNSSTQLVFWNASNSIYIDINTNLNANKLAYTIDNSSSNTYFCQNGNGSTVNGNTTSQLCNSSSRITSSSIGGNINVVPEPYTLMGAFPLLCLGLNRLRKRKKSQEQAIPHRYSVINQVTPIQTNP